MSHAVPLRRVLFQILVLWGAAAGTVFGQGANAFRLPMTPQGARNSTAAIRIVLLPSIVPNACFEVQGLKPDVVRALRGLNRQDGRWKRVLAVYVANSDTESQIPILGTYELAGENLRFHPRFPLERGLAYRAVFDESAAVTSKERATRITRTITVPVCAAGPATRLIGIYPSAEEVPENLLRIYLQFSAPMSQGDSYRYIHLRDEATGAVEGAILAIPQELWDPSGTRLTLLLDPGRVKTGLVPRSEAGPVLTAGHTYALRVDPSWPDADGRSLAASVIKTFRAGPRINARLDSQQWKIVSPAIGGRNPLVIRFPYPLDYAMLHSAIRVMRGSEELAGTVRTKDHETRWTFLPQEPWQRGHYAVVASAELEDCAGNNLLSPFEVDSSRPGPSRQPGRRELQIEFQATEPAR